MSRPDPEAEELLRDVERVCGLHDHEEPAPCPLCGRTGGCKCDDEFEEGFKRG